MIDSNSSDTRLYIWNIQSSTQNSKLGFVVTVCGNVLLKKHHDVQVKKNKALFHLFHICGACFIQCGKFGGNIYVSSAPLEQRVNTQIFGVSV